MVGIEIKGLVKRFELSSGIENGWVSMARDNIKDSSMVRRLIDESFSYKVEKDIDLGLSVEALSDPLDYIQGKRLGTDSLRASLASRMLLKSMSDFGKLLFEVKEFKTYKKMGVKTWIDYCNDILHSDHKAVDLFIRMVIRNELHTNDLFMLGNIVDERARNECS